jgi:electron transport complex protein RnfG
MKSKDNNFHNFVAPILVLVIICFVVTFALAMTYGVTKPVIDKNTLAAANEARADIMPQAKGKFEEVKTKHLVLEKNKVFVDDVYKASNGAGCVITVESSSYGGLLTAMVGIDKDGAITKVKITNASDTPGVGTRAQEPGHLKQYNGLKKLGNEQIKSDPTVQHVSGASISSEAIHKAVFCALKQFNNMGGVK